MRSSAFFFAAFLSCWSDNLPAAFLSAIALRIEFLTPGGKDCKTALASFRSARSAAVNFAAFFLVFGFGLGFVLDFFFLPLKGFNLSNIFFLPSYFLLVLFRPLFTTVIGRPAISVKIFPSFVRTGVFPDLYISLNARPRSGFDLPLFLADDLTPRIASCIAKVFSLPLKLGFCATCAILLVAAGLLGFVFGLRPRSSTGFGLGFGLT
jgi:hypothetical protein